MTTASGLLATLSVPATMMESTASEERSENLFRVYLIFESSEVTATSLRPARRILVTTGLLSSHVIILTLFSISEARICYRYFLKSFGCLWRMIFIWMQLYG